ncbi:MAG: hypothetical protein ABUK01_10075 [Leptospirales bacterium]
MRHIKLLFILLVTITLTSGYYAKATTEVAEKKITIAYTMHPIYTVWNAIPGIYEGFWRDLDYNLQVNIATGKRSHLNLNFRRSKPFMAWSSYASQLDVGLGYRFMLGAFNKKTGVTALNGFWIAPTISMVQIKDAYISEDYYYEHNNGNPNYTDRMWYLGFETGHHWVLKSGFTIGLKLGYRVGFDQGYISLFNLRTSIITGIDIGWSF